MERARQDLQAFPLGFMAKNTAEVIDSFRVALVEGRDRTLRDNVGPDCCCCHLQNADIGLTVRRNDASS
jgi:hypothetical protein